MKVYNTVPYFLRYYEPTQAFLESYYKKYSRHFQEYFLYHCKQPEVKIKAAIQKFNIPNIKEIAGTIENYIYEIVAIYEQKYNVKFEKDVHVIVGAFGSNAFTHRQIIPEVTFCVEKLSPKAEHLKVIIAHEFGHALHNTLSDKEGMNWSMIQWNHPYTALLQEGCATYFSKQVTEANESVYFSYDDRGEEWLTFAEDNMEIIVSAFMSDLKNKTYVEMFHEWFSINGGRHFGFTRLGYYIGYQVLLLLIEKYKELQAVTIWKKPNFFAEIDNILFELRKGCAMGG